LSLKSCAFSFICSISILFNIREWFLTQKSIYIYIYSVLSLRFCRNNHKLVHYYVKSISALFFNKYLISKPTPYCWKLKILIVKLTKQNTILNYDVVVEIFCLSSHWTANSVVLYSIDFDLLTNWHRLLTYYTHLFINKSTRTMTTVKSV